MKLSKFHSRPSDFRGVPEKKGKPVRIRIPRSTVADAAERAVAHLERGGGEVEDAILRMGGNLDPRAAYGRDREALRQFAAESFAAILHELRIDWRA